MTNDTHIVKSYGEELQFLNEIIMQMGSLTESLLTDSMNAITILDKDAVDRIVQSDKKINEYRAKIDTQIMTILVKRAPMAIDRSEEHTSELQSHSFISYAVFCLKKKTPLVTTYWKPSDHNVNRY